MSCVDKSPRQDGSRLAEKSRSASGYKCIESIENFLERHSQVFAGSVVVVVISAKPMEREAPAEPMAESYFSSINCVMIASVLFMAFNVRRLPLRSSTHAVGSALMPSDRASGLSQPLPSK